MSEVQSRPAGSRGRGSFRGGRGGFRGGRGGSKPHKSEDQENIPPSSPPEQGEIGELKKQYGSKVSTLRELFPDWSDEDLVYALKETDGDLESAIDRMSSGSISQWQENKKKQPKPKEVHSSAGETTTATRGGRSRGGVEGRGRGRGTDRGRGGRGGRASAQANGTRSGDTAVKTTNEGWGDAPAPAADASGGWDNNAGVDVDTTAAGDWTTDPSNHAASTATSGESKSDAIPTGKVLGWNKLFEKPKPTPVTKQPPPTAPQPQHETALPPSTVEETIADERLPPPPTDPEILAGAESAVNETPDPPPSEPTIALNPSKDELTETNLERLPDTSHPPATTTAASTAASTQDPRSSSINPTPAPRPGVGISGYAANAARATSGAGRPPSFVRRVMEQQEAVVMPANHAVDRAAVQFGSMGLNGSAEDLDVDEDREEPMTRTPLQDDSPVAPRASLPPPPAQAQAQAPSEHISAPRQAPGLPPVPIQQSNSPQQANAYADQFARYGQSGQKAYDPFGQQHVQPSQPQPQTQIQTQEPFTTQTPSQTQQISSSAPNDYPSYYSANQQRDTQAAYQNYYGGYGQTQDVQQRSGSAFGSSGQDTQAQYATSRPQPNYGQQEAQNSGNNTPNPVISGQQTQPSQQMHQGQASQAGYPYGYSNTYSQQYPQYGASYMNQMSTQQHRYGQHRPMFDDVRRQGEDYYMSPNSQYGYGHGQQYGGAPYNKSSMYGQPQHQYSYEHSASPANAGGFGQTSMAGREAMYGRTGSTQPSEAQQGVGAPFGSMNDPFARTHSGFGTQAQPMSQQHSAQQGSGVDAAKEYDTAKTGGPSPSISQANRPGSATNMPGQQQSGQAAGFPAPQSQQAGQNAFGGYPQYSGLGSFGGHHQGQNNHHQQTAGYGSYSGGAGFGSYAGYGSGRGWNGNYSGGH